MIEFVTGSAYGEAVAAGKYILERLATFTDNFDENRILECAGRIREACASPLSTIDSIFLYKYALFLGIG